MQMQFANRTVDLSEPRVMGILNLTPDSFFDGGCYFGEGRSLASALRQAEKMVDEGATFIDIGGESTRPGANPVSEQEEMDRVLPVVEALNTRLDAVISIDTSSPALMKAALGLGVGLINDVRALQREGALQSVQPGNAAVCLMHMQGQPQVMQNMPEYGDVVADVVDFLVARIAACEAAGIARSRILLDPGFGFGKRDQHNLALLKNLQQIREVGCPVLVGLSRKSLLGRLLGREPQERLAGSLSLAQFALHYGASILRVHDVAETVDIVKLFKIMNT